MFQHINMNPSWETPSQRGAAGRLGGRGVRLRGARHRCRRRRPPTPRSEGELFTTQGLSLSHAGVRGTSCDAIIRVSERLQEAVEGGFLSMHLSLLVSAAEERGEVCTEDGILHH